MPKPRRIYRRLVDDFGDQRDQASIARERLAGLQPRATPTARNVEPRVLCEQCGGVGAVSRDGRWFVVSNVGSEGDIERRDLASNTVERMRAKSAAVSPAQGGSQAYWPILSADSRQIVYSALVNNPTAPGAQPEGADRQLYVIAADGRSEATLVQGAGVYRHPVWTPDSTHVVYVSDVSGTSDLWAIAVRDGRAAGEPKLLRKDVGDVVSLGMTDTGVYHYFSSRSGVHRASIVPIVPAVSRGNASGGTSANGATVESVVGQAARWSPDGRSVALIRPRPRSVGAFDVVVKDLASGNERVYRDEYLVDQRPTWFPDGRSLLLVTARGQQRPWVRLDVTSGRFTALVDLTEVQKGWGGFLVRPSAVLSPDGRTVYVAASSSTTKTTIGRIDRIVALDLETGAVRSLTLPGDDQSLPFVTQGIAIALSPDGQTLAIATRGNKPGTTRLATMDLNGGNYRELTSAFTNDTFTNTLAWSRDGRSIFLVDRGERAGDRVMRVSKDGGTPVFTGVRVAGLRNFDLSPDGTRLIYGTANPEGAGRLHSTLDVKALLASRP